jgi:hypothetical protein
MATDLPAELGYHWPEQWKPDDSFYAYVPNDLADPIDRATRFFDAGDALWHLPLVLALTDLKSTHAGVWDERCVNRLLPLTKSPNCDACLLDLQRLRELRDRRASRYEFGEWIQRIWYRNGTRDEVQTAIAQLYGAVECQLYPHSRHPLVLLGVGTTLIAQGEGFRIGYCLQRRRSSFSSMYNA